MISVSDIYQIQYISFVLRMDAIRLLFASGWIPFVVGCQQAGAVRLVMSQIMAAAYLQVDTIRL